jgi:hypothetical protein
MSEGHVPIVFRRRADTIEKADDGPLRRSRRGSILNTNERSGVLLTSGRVVDARKRFDDVGKHYVYAIGTLTPVHLSCHGLLLLLTREGGKKIELCVFPHTESTAWCNQLLQRCMQHQFRSAAHSGPLFIVSTSG